jgi:hypothetical protein
MKALWCAVGTLWACVLVTGCGETNSIMQVPVSGVEEGSKPNSKLAAPAEDKPAASQPVAPKPDGKPAVSAPKPATTTARLRLYVTSESLGKERPGLLEDSIVISADGSGPRTRRQCLIR